MDMEKYTERSKGFVQSAQNLALRSGHQRLTPEHLAKVLLEDKEGLCANLIQAAGGDPKIVLAQIEAELNKMPRVEGSGAGQVYLLLGALAANVWLAVRRWARRQPGQVGPRDKRGADAQRSGI